MGKTGIGKVVCAGIGRNGGGYLGVASAGEGRDDGLGSAGSRKRPEHRAVNAKGTKAEKLYLPFTTGRCCNRFKILSREPFPATLCDFRK